MKKHEDTQQSYKMHLYHNGLPSRYMIELYLKEKGKKKKARVTNYYGFTNDPCETNWTYFKRTMKLGGEKSLISQASHGRKVCLGGGSVQQTRWL